KIEDPDAERSRQQYWLSCGSHSASENIENGTVEPRFQGSEIGHKHRPEMRVAEHDGVQVAMRFVNILGKESFVVLNADVRQKDVAGGKKEETGCQRTALGWKSLGKGGHFFELGVENRW